jgi:methionyl-tRNA formyltransferase
MNLRLPKIQKIVLLGGSPLLVSLALWCKSRDVDVCVITAPRHAEETIENDLSLLQILDLNSIKYFVESNISAPHLVNYLSDLSSSFCLSIGGAWIFNEDIIKSVFQGRLFNVHGTRLPQNRGGGGFSWQILMGSHLGFCQLHLVDTGVDTGGIVATEEFLYPASCRVPKDYQSVFHEKALDFISGFFERIISSALVFEVTKQSDYLSSYWPRLNTEINGWIDWGEDIQYLERFVCAFDDPYRGAKTYLNSEQVHIKNVIVDFSDQAFHPFQYGLIYRKGPAWIFVSARGGCLIVQNITDKHGNDIYEKVRVGDRLFTPLHKTQSRIKRVSYSPLGLNV